MRRACLWCDEPIDLTERRDKKFCDPRCKSKYHHHPNRPKERNEKKYVRQCETCQRGYMTSWRTGTQFCSHTCRSWWIQVKRRRCNDCGVVLVNFTPGGGPRRCADCKKARARNSARRKRMKRSGVRAARYSISHIAMRDGFVCHLCNRRVDMRKNGNRLDGPTLDHLVPISAGGTDTPENVRLAHRDCNTRRGTGGTVQLLLVG